MAGGRGCCGECKRREDAGRKHDQSVHRPPLVTCCKEPLHERRLVLPRGADRPDRHAGARRDVRDRARVAATRSRSSRSSCGTSGVSGFGEAAPIERYDESAASALAFVEAHGRAARRRSRSRSRRSSARLPPGEHAARAAIDAALHDLQGKLARRPASGGCSGLPRTGPPTSWTVWLGDPGRHGAPRRDGRARASGG